MVNINLKNYIILFLLIIPLNAEFITKKFSIIDGLIEGEIRDIFQDDIGRIWTLTDNDISIFDGYDFYNKKFPQKYNIDYAIEGQSTDNSQCWILTNKGIIKFPKWNWRITKFGYSINKIINFKKVKKLFGNLHT